MGLQGLSELARGIKQLIFPNTCLICDSWEGDRTDFRDGLCDSCHASVTNEPTGTCRWCAATIGPHTAQSTSCGACRSQAFGFDAAIRLGPYDGKLRDAILRMKGANGEGLAEQMGRVFWETARTRVSNLGLTCVVPVPLHWQRRFTRGHNQAAGIARELAGGLGIEFALNALRRTRNTPQQGQPTASARRENVKGVFQVTNRARIKGSTVLLVDDVMTTGSTTSEAGRTLKSAGAKTVVVAVLARR